MFFEAKLMKTAGASTVVPLLVLLGLLAVASAGCQSRAPAVKEGESNNLAKIQTAYDSATRKLGRPPANLEELNPHLRELGDPTELLRSPRDGQPYVILW